LRLLRPPAPTATAIVIVIAMVLGSYVSLHMRRGGQLTLPEGAAVVCTEEAPGEGELENKAPHAGLSQGGGCAPFPLGPVDSEVELEGDELLLAETVSITLRRGSERFFDTLPVPCSHVSDLSRRPPRASLA
jgi:hypothetical protein